MAAPAHTGRALHAWLAPGLALTFVIFSSPTLWTRLRPDAPTPYPAVTLALAGLVTLLVVRWPRAAESSPRPQLRAGAIAVALAAAALVGLGLHRWMDAMLWQPLDAVRGDMLVVTQAAIRALLNSRDPYALYHVPWEAPMPYGPVLWAPFIVPHVLHADLRLMTIVGEAFVPVWCGAAAVVDAARARPARAGAWLALLAVIVLNPELAVFTTVGHTPSYWPLIPLFAVFVTAGHWNAAALVFALLVAGRTTMISIVPVFFIAVWSIAFTRLRATILVFASALGLLILPFALWNPATIWYGMVASYPRVMKEAVWVSPDGGAINTIGVTGWLLAHQLQAFVEAVQVGSLLAVYAAAWRFIRRGAAPLPWMGLALLAFSMTSLWPVYYIYFDVLLFFVSAAIAVSLNAKAAPMQTMSVWGMSVAATVAAVLLALVLEAPAAPAADFDGVAARPLHSGFVSAGDALSGSAAIWGTEATLMLPRRTTSSADIVMRAQPVIPEDSGPQAVTAVLNGVLLGTATVGRGWSDIVFQAPAAAWRAGSNRLDLECVSSAVPNEVGLGSEARHISLAIRRIEVVPK